MPAAHPSRPLASCPGVRKPPPASPPPHHHPRLPFISSAGAQEGAGPPAGAHHQPGRRIRGRECCFVVVSRVLFAAACVLRPARALRPLRRELAGAQHGSDGEVQGGCLGCQLPSLGPPGCSMPARCHVHSWLAAQACAAGRPWLMIPSASPPWAPEIDTASILPWWCRQHTTKPCCAANGCSTLQVVAQAVINPRSIDVSLRDVGGLDHIIDVSAWLADCVQLRWWAGCVLSWVTTSWIRIPAFNPRRETALPSSAGCDAQRHHPHAPPQLFPLLAAAPEARRAALRPAWHRCGRCSIYSSGSCLTACTGWLVTLLRLLGSVLLYRLPGTPGWAKSGRVAPAPAAG